MPVIGLNDPVPGSPVEPVVFRSIPNQFNLRLRDAIRYKNPVFRSLSRFMDRGVTWDGRFVAFEPLTAVIDGGNHTHPQYGRDGWTPANVLWTLGRRVLGCRTSFCAGCLFARFYGCGDSSYCTASDGSYSGYNRALSYCNPGVRGGDYTCCRPGSRGDGLCGVWVPYGTRGHSVKGFSGGELKSIMAAADSGMPAKPSLHSRAGVTLAEPDDPRAYAHRPPNPFRPVPV